VDGKVRIATLRNDMANLSASGLPGTPGGTARAAIDPSGDGQANNDIDQVNADDTEAYPVGNSMVTGHGPGAGRAGRQRRSVTSAEIRAPLATAGGASAPHPV
jgi:hypothetical protein